MKDKEGMIRLNLDMKGRPGQTYTLEIRFDYNGIPHCDTGSIQAHSSGNNAAGQLIGPAFFAFFSELAKL